MPKHEEVFTRVYFANGVFMSVLEEIMEAQSLSPDKVCYLQPYSNKVITQLRNFTAEKGYTWQLYASTSSDLTQVHYVADIVGWENKNNLSDDRLAELNQHMQEFQKGEPGIYFDKGVNLIAIKNLRRLLLPIPKSNCIKIEDDKPFLGRSQPGGFGYVYPVEIQFASTSFHNSSLLEKEFSENVKERIKDTKETLLARLAVANKLPSKIQMVSSGFKRNPDVVAYVLKRANGICELCCQPSPFRKASDNTPYLEVHHWLQLANGGEDTIENAAALCPNCHKEAHFGVNSENIKQSRVPSE